MLRYNQPGIVLRSWQQLQSATAAAVVLACVRSMGCMVYASWCLLCALSYRMLTYMFIVDYASHASDVASIVRSL